MPTKDNDLDNDLYEDDDEDEDIELDDVDFDVGGENDFRSRGRRMLNTVGQVGRERIGQAANQHKHRVADRIDDFGSRVGGRISTSAEYLRSNDVTVIAEDLIDTVRRHPLLSAGVALGAGYMAGKVIGMTSGGRNSSTSNKIKRAVVSSLAAMAATKLKDTLTSQVIGALSGDDDEDEEEEVVVSRPPRKRRPARPRSSRKRGDQ